MSKSDSVYHEAAAGLIKTRGYEGALMYAKHWRDMYSKGTAPFAFHNAVAKEISKLTKEANNDNCTSI